MDNLDGLEPDGVGGGYLTDWASGDLFHAEPDGRARQLLDLPPGSADNSVIPASKIMLVLMMNKSELVESAVNGRLTCSGGYPISPETEANSAKCIAQSKMVEKAEAIPAHVHPEDFNHLI